MPEFGIFSVSVPARLSLSNSLGTVCSVLQFAPWVDTVKLVPPGSTGKCLEVVFLVTSKQGWFCGPGVWLAPCKWGGGGLGSIVWLHRQLFIPPLYFEWFHACKINIYPKEGYSHLKIDKKYISMLDSA